MKKIGDVCDVIPGFAFKSKNLGENGIPVIKIGNITENRTIDIDSAQCFPNNLVSEKHKKFFLRNGDILIAMTGATAGKMGRIRCPEGHVLLLNQRVAKLSPKTINPDFFWCIVSTDRYRTIFYGLGGGAAQPNMSGAQIESVEIPYPPPIEQDRIASTLTAYDNLIENNRRRIQLLEQAARLLYKEWFVHLRFPGHEHVKIKDGVPEGWERKPLGEIAPLNYGKALKKDDRVPGSVPVYGSSGIVGTHIKPLASGPAIIVGRKGNVGSVYWSENDFWPIDTVYFIESNRCTFYLYYALLHIQFINTDVAVPGLNRDFAHSREILWPDAGILRFFEEFVTPLHEQITTLRKTNESLVAARDLLLPRLMNGEIAV
ncbi:MAG: restriction endonuclease subunit S [Deltaproteobacteria bacterium]|nr:restriction endonuclease subunit S [Deltaproteobacteria bacterium]